MRVATRMSFMNDIQTLHSCCHAHDSIFRRYILVATRTRHNVASAVWSLFLHIYSLPLWLYFTAYLSIYMYMIVDMKGHNASAPVASVFLNISNYIYIYV